MQSGTLVRQAPEAGVEPACVQLPFHRFRKARGYTGMEPPVGIEPTSSNYGIRFRRPGRYGGILEQRGVVETPYPAWKAGTWPICQRCMMESAGGDDPPTCAMARHRSDPIELRRHSGDAPENRTLLSGFANHHLPSRYGHHWSVRLATIQRPSGPKPDALPS